MNGVKICETLVLGIVSIVVLFENVNVLLWFQYSPSLFYTVAYSARKNIIYIMTSIQNILGTVIPYKDVNVMHNVNIA